MSSAQPYLFCIQGKQKYDIKKLFDFDFCINLLVRLNLGCILKISCLVTVLWKFGWFRIPDCVSEGEKKYNSTQAGKISIIFPFSFRLGRVWQ